MFKKIKNINSAIGGTNKPSSHGSAPPAGYPRPSAPPGYPQQVSNTYPQQPYGGYSMTPGGQPHMGQSYPQQSPMGQSYSQQFPMGQSYPQQSPMGQPYPQQSHMRQSQMMSGMSAAQKYGIPPQSISVLSGYDVMFVVDDSYSMNDGDRIMQVRETITMFAEVACEYDTDGIDLCFLNNTHVEQTVTDPRAINPILDGIRWDGATPIGNRLSQILTQYYQLLAQAPNTKPISIVIITDGAPTDKHLLEETIVECSRKMQQRGTPNQVAIQFFQVGNDQYAKKYLISLDDDLKTKHQINDIVDCVHCGDGRLPLKDRFIKALVGGIDDSVDNVYGY